jgi:hypothetical protein
MKTFRKITKRVGIAMIFSVLLSGSIYVNPYALAISVEKGNFVMLGKVVQDNKGHKEMLDEKIPLWIRPGINDTVQARVKSGTVVLVLDKTTVQGKNFYIVSTVGKEGGMIGWVSEDYIYKIVPVPNNE